MQNFLADDDLGPQTAAGLPGIPNSRCRCERQSGPPGSGSALAMDASWWPRLVLEKLQD